MLISIPYSSLNMDQVPLHLRAYIPRAAWYTFIHKLDQADGKCATILIPCSLLGFACFIVVITGVGELFTAVFSLASIVPIAVVIVVVSSFLCCCVSTVISELGVKKAIRELHDELEGVRVQIVGQNKFGDDDCEDHPNRYSCQYLEILVPAPAPGTSAQRLIKAALIEELNRMRGITNELKYEVDLIQILKSIESIPTPTIDLERCSAVGAVSIKRLKSQKRTLTKEVFINRLIETVEALYETPPCKVADEPEVPSERTAPLNVSSQNTIEEIPTKETNPLQYSWRCEGA